MKDTAVRRDNPDMAFGVHLLQVECERQIMFAVPLQTQEFEAISADKVLAVAARQSFAAAIAVDQESAFIKDVGRDGHLLEGRGLPAHMALAHHPVRSVTRVDMPKGAGIPRYRH